MAWNFNEIAEYFRQYAGVDGLSGAAFFGEWSAENGFDLSDYPIAFNSATPPVDYLGASQEALVFVDVGAGFVPVTTLPGYVGVGRGTRGEMSSGVQTTIVINGWGAKGIGFGYVLGMDTTLAQMQADAIATPATAQGILLVRGDIATDGTITQIITMNDPFTAQDLTDLNAWLGAHNVTPTEFRTKLGWASTAEGQTFMTTNPRRAFLQRVHDLWGG